VSVIQLETVYQAVTVINGTRLLLFCSKLFKNFGELPHFLVILTNRRGMLTLLPAIVLLLAAVSCRCNPVFDPVFRIPSPEEGILSHFMSIMWLQENLKLANRTCNLVERAAVITLISRQ
jgi:hypothetical protein